MDTANRVGYFIMLLLIFAIIVILVWITVGAWRGELGMKSPDRKLATLFGIVTLIPVAAFVWLAVKMGNEGLFTY